jgi:predicted acyltransferase
MHPYNNTLQTIAVGYLAAALTILVRSAAMRIVIPVLLAALYGGALWVYGDWTADGNFARLVDERVFAAIGCKAKSFTYVATSLVWAAIGIAGMHAALILKSEREQWAKAKILSLAGLAITVLGAAILPWVPPIRHIYSLSFSLISTGLSFLLLALLYVITDIGGHRSHWGYILLFGEFAFLSWWLHTFFGPALLKVAELCFVGVPHLMGTGKYMPVINELGLVAVFAGVLYVRKRLSAH